MINSNQHNTSELLTALCDELDSDIELASASSNLSASGASPTEADETDQSIRYTETRLSEDAVDDVDGWLDNESLQQTNSKHVIAQLDAIILLMITIRGEASGKELCQDLQRLFGADLSPGTVYPCLTELTEAGSLNMHQFTRSKVYQLSDEEVLHDRVVPKVNALLTAAIELKFLTMASTADTTRNDDGLD